MMKNENYENHSFSIKLATDLGLESAIILQHLFFWCRANSDNQDMIKDGYIWVYISRKKINAIYPYLKEGKIKGAIDRLQKEGYIKIANYNKLKIDKTNWYGLTDKAYMLFGTSLAILTNGEQKSPTIGENNQAIQTINHNNIETNKKEDTNVSWKKDFAIYINLVHDAANRLLADSKHREYMNKYYPNIDYEATIQKMIDSFWGIEEGWEYCKKHRKGETINMYSALKKNMDDRRKIIYKSKDISKKKEVINKSLNIHPELKIVDEEGSLSDGTFIKNGHRYYFSNRKGTSFSVPMDEEPKPSGDCWEYAYGTGWYEEID